MAKIIKRNVVDLILGCTRISLQIASKCKAWTCTDLGAKICYLKYLRSHKNGAKGEVEVDTIYLIEYPYVFVYYTARIIFKNFDHINTRGIDLVKQLKWHARFGRQAQISYCFLDVQMYSWTCTAIFIWSGNLGIC